MHLVESQYSMSALVNEKSAQTCSLNRWKQSQDVGRMNGVLQLESGGGYSEGRVWDALAY